MLYIVIEDLFEGTLDQFKDCFFSNATPELIEEWCEKHQYNKPIFINKNQVSLF